MVLPLLTWKRLADNVEGYLRASEISAERVEDASKHLNVDDEVEAKFIGVDRKNRVINLSIKAKDHAEEQKAIKEFSKEQADDSAPATLGDLLKEKMDQQDA